MERIYRLFLQATAAALKGEQVDWEESVSSDEWAALLELAQLHHILPMFLEAVLPCPASGTIEPAQLSARRRDVIGQVSAQSVRTSQFLELIRQLQNRGVPVLVVKGIVCRQLYPLPDHRVSGDEDLLCDEADFAACHATLTELGFVPCGEEGSYEVPYRHSSGLYIELHKALFSPDSEIFREYNHILGDVFANATHIIVDGQPVATLHPTDHMLYLLLHAFKHFLHSGFGIRQVCDMALFAERNSNSIDWDTVTARLRTLRAEKFAAAVFAIGRDYLRLTADPIPVKVDALPLLEDLLCAGVYGTADRSRTHSAAMTLGAVRSGKKVKKSAGLAVKSLFPDAGSLQNRYPYLQKKPWLLPVAWLERFAGYAKETAKGVSAPKKTLRIGDRRIQLLKHYDIID